MSARRAINREPDWEAIWSELGRGSDRAAVIVGHALLEESLSGLLRSCFVDDPDVSDRVVCPGDRPMNLKRSADLAFALGLITTFELNELRAIADLRNHFAHVVEGASFDGPLAQRAMETLLAQRRFMTQEDESPRHLFAVVVTVLYFDIESRARDAVHVAVRVATYEQILHRMVAQGLIKDAR